MSRIVGQTRKEVKVQGYYSAKLSGDRLQKCYEVAPARVRQYLEAEISFVIGRLRPGDSVLELGCGYGRVAFRLGEVAVRVPDIWIARRPSPLDHVQSVGRCRFGRMIELRPADRWERGFLGRSRRLRSTVSDRDPDHPVGM